MNFLVNLNLNKNELQNAVIQPLSTAPSNAVQGQIYYNTVDKVLYQYDGTQWKQIGTTYVLPAATSSTLGGIIVSTGLSVDSSGNATVDYGSSNPSMDGSASAGSANSASRSDHVHPSDTAKLDKSGGTMSGDIAMGSNSITGLAAPTNNADAATKKYVDDLISGLGAYLDFKGSVASTTNLPLTGNKKGDVYIVTSDGSEYVWTSSSASGSLSDYEKLGTTVDLSGYLQLSGGTMTGNIAMGSNSITGLAAPTNNADAATKSYVDTGLSGLVKTATGTIATNATSASVSYSGTLINAYATMSGSIVQVDKAVTSSAVTFSTAASPSSAVTCTVVYA